MISSPVVQVIPVYGSSGSCHQASLLLHEDRSLSVIPGDAETMALVKEQLARTQNGLYTHVVDKATSRLESFQVTTAADSTLISQHVGRTSFTGERVTRVAYPIRDEMVQTMSTILGDNSLLLKYINPHLAVVMTIADADAKTSIAESLEKTQGTAPKRKPVGVGDAASAETKADDTVANLFVNLVDTISGRILHRTSHANADIEQDMIALITENWVIYSFVNSKTHRTELGVLTLHEGMIDPKGIGMFTSPEQSTSFSSFDVRESKPVVLSKTYIFPKHITALGVTSTRGGISSRNILIASDDGKITAVNRMMLETRRPMGAVKDVEKKEGLYPYSELIIQVPYLIISYNQTLEAVTSVVSVPTALESQSLVLAFGGPDLFFTRTSPSKGFDLLPDSFSRVLVFIVTSGLVILLFVIQRMGSKKALKNSWL
jgi:ER membrane protein complex subunit 1